MAAKQLLVQNTVFVIVADHCSSSAGKTELPMDKYRIPAMIYYVQNLYFHRNFLKSSSDRCDAYRFGIIEFKYQSKFF